MCVIAILLVFSFAFDGSEEYLQPWKTIYDRVQDESDFSGYRTMVKGNKDVTMNLLYSGVTVFAPRNDAIARYDGFYSDAMVLYHLGSEPSTLRELSLNYSLESVHAANPPLWVTVIDDGYYINNAKIIEQYSNYVGKCKRNQGLRQVLHIIDRVLDPMLQTPYTNPSAHDLLENYHNWKLGSRHVSNFFKRVQFHQKEDLFKKRGGHTFFIPINDKTHDHRLEDIDSYIIEGHVVPNVVLFTRPSTKNFFHESVANGDYIYILISMVQQNGRDYVKSYTVLGNSEHRKGEVLSEIVVANIPVTNGVVHLISQPLAVFDRELKPFPYLSVAYKIGADPELSISQNFVQKGRVGKILRTEKGMYTVFVPRNRAWMNYLGYKDDELLDIFSRHVIVSDGRFTMSKLATSSEKSGTIIESLGGTFKISVVYTNETFFLIWGQKWIRVYRPDYECSDGVVHLIDDVFATPRLPSPAQQQQKASFWKLLKDIVT